MEDVVKIEAPENDANKAPPKNPAKVKLKRQVEGLFTERLMIALAIIAIPVIIIEYFSTAGSEYFYLALAVDWVIWAVFLMEFTLKLYTAEGKMSYMSTHKLESAISIVIIASPLIGLVSNVFTALPALRLVTISRALRLTKVTETTQVARPAAYAGSAAATELRPQRRQETFVISRTELRQVLISLGINEKSIANIMTALDKTHRHTNIIIFTNMMEKLGIDRIKMANIFRRIGMDDVTISNTFRMVDESKIRAETGRIFEASVDFE